MRKLFQIWVRVLLTGAMTLALTPHASARKSKHHADLTVNQILGQMNEKSKNLWTISADLEYTKFTALVNDKSIESGRFFFKREKSNTDILIDIEKPDRRILLLKKNKGQMYFPKINQIQEYNLQQKSDLVQQFLLLGFGTDTNALKKSYTVNYLREEDLGDDTTAVLELVPLKNNVTSQISKIQIWVSEESWLPAQQQFFEPDGDSLTARYLKVVRDRQLPSSTFELKAPSSAKRVQMN
jgi:outer membrane lipoprotein-sorting protein